VTKFIGSNRVLVDEGVGGVEFFWLNFQPPRAFYVAYLQLPARGMIKPVVPASVHKFFRNKMHKSCIFLLKIQKILVKWEGDTPSSATRPPTLVGQLDLCSVVRKIFMKGWRENGVWPRSIKMFFQKWRGCPRYCPIRWGTVTSPLCLWKSPLPSVRKGLSELFLTETIYT